MKQLKKLIYLLGTILGFIVWGILITGAFFYVQNLISSHFFYPNNETLSQAQNSGVFNPKNIMGQQNNSMVGGIINNQLNPSKTELINRAGKIGDFTHVPEGYYVTNAVDALGLTAVIAEHSTSQQYMAIVDTGWILQVDSTDIQSGKLKSKLLTYASKVLPAHIKVKSFKLVPSGTFTAFNQQVPYAQGKAVIYDTASKLSYTYRGIIGIVAKPDGSKNDIIVAVNLQGEADKQVAERFFQKVNLQ
jgi:hypothetical protein